MEGEERITIRLSSDSLALLEELVDRGMFVNEAEAVRKAVDALIDRILSAEEKVAVLEKAARRRELDIKDFTSDGTDGGEVLKNVIARGLDSRRDEDD